MATHSVTTAAALEDGEMFRVTRKGGNVRIRLSSKSEAVSELSEGIATLDTGLRIAASNAAQITILTEGKYALHLQRWAALYFPGENHMFDELPSRTSDSELKTHHQLLAKMNTNSHFLIVWDCDAKQSATKLSEELPKMANVTAFVFEKREDAIGGKGIENKYDQDLLRPYARQTTEYLTGDKVCLFFPDNRKSQFAEHIFSNGMAENFRHFDDLWETVRGILARLPS